MVNTEYCTQCLFSSPKWPTMCW